MSSGEECCKVNLFKSLADTVSQVVSHPGLCAESEKAERMNVCRACEHFDWNSKKCNKCGCFMELKTKFSGAKCPIDKW